MRNKSIPPKKHRPLENETTEKYIRQTKKKYSYTVRIAQKDQHSGMSVKKLLIQSVLRDRYPFGTFWYFAVSRAFLSLNYSFRFLVCFFLAAAAATAVATVNGCVLRVDWEIPMCATVFKKLEILLLSFRSVSLFESTINYGNIVMATLQDKGHACNAGNPLETEKRVNER